MGRSNGVSFSGTTLPSNHGKMDAKLSNAYGLASTLNNISINTTGLTHIPSNIPMANTNSFTHMLNNRSGTYSYGLAHNKYIILPKQDITETGPLKMNASFVAVVKNHSNDTVNLPIDLLCTKKRDSGCNAEERKRQQQNKEKNGKSNIYLHT